MREPVEGRVDLTKTEAKLNEDPPEKSWKGKAVDFIADQAKENLPKLAEELIG